MKKLLCVAFLLSVVKISLGWQRYSHGNKHLVSGMTFMQSHTTKLFGVDVHGRHYGNGYGLDHGTGITMVYHLTCGVSRSCVQHPVLSQTGKSS